MDKAKVGAIWFGEIRKVLKGKHPEIAIACARLKIKAAKVMTFADKSAKD